jgi:hypothetical protein
MAAAKKVTHQQFRVVFSKAAEKYNNGEAVHAPGPAAELTVADLQQSIEDTQKAIEEALPFLGWLPGEYSQSLVDISAILKLVARQLK